MHLGDVLPEAVAARERGEAAVMVTVVADHTGAVPPATRMLVLERRHIGSIHPALDPLLIAEARQRMTSRKPGARSYSLHGEARDVGVKGGDLDAYFDLLPRPLRLVIVGAGHIAVPLARMASLLDFHVTVLDDRPEYASSGRFPTADTILAGPYAETLASLPIDVETHVVLVTRGHVHDAACLDIVLGSPAPYIGMIGSKRRVRTVLRHAEGSGDMSRVYAPIGLDIGSQTPAEIALAIMAEIVNLRRGGHAPSLRLQGRTHA